ncbi:MAG: hypothetical protein ACJAWG_003259, partial [Candidatus Azotimanducaceae bacterium]
ASANDSRYSHADFTKPLKVWKFRCRRHSLGQSSLGQSSLGQSSLGQSSLGQSSLGQNNFLED